MYKVTIPGRGQLNLENLVLDMNGTISIDGSLLPGVKWRVSRLRETFKIYLLTADTFGSAEQVSSELGVELKVVSPLHGGQDKVDTVNSLGCLETVAIGNGFNDVGMLRAAGLSICVMGKEGCSTQALQAAMIAVNDIRDALDLLLVPERLVATLRV